MQTVSLGTCQNLFSGGKRENISMCCLPKISLSMRSIKIALSTHMLNLNINLLQSTFFT